MNNLRLSKGFTLLEMMIAMALSAVVATMAFESFDAATRNAQRTRDVLNTVNKLDRAWQVIGQDMRNLLPAGTANQLPPGPPQTPPQTPKTPGKTPPQTPPPGANIPQPNQTRFEGVSLKTKGKDSFQLIMVFARRGWANPLGRLRSDLQQVNYRLAEGKLWRDYMPERNMPLENIDFERESLHQLLLDNVSDVQLRFLSDAKIKSSGQSVLEGPDYSNDWEPSWPPQGAGGPVGMPIAIEITIETTSKEGAVGRSVRLFELPQK